MQITNQSDSPGVLALAITKVEDSKGVSIPNNGTTLDTELTLSGTGTAYAVITVLDNGQSVGTASVDAVGGWKKDFSAALGRHVFTAREGAQDSPTWTVTVENEQVVVPMITNIQDAQNVEIPDGGQTRDTDVTLRGSAKGGETVEIFDQNVTRGTANVNPAGVWSKILDGLALGAHVIKAKGLYGNNPESAVRSFTVNREPLDLIKPEVVEAFGANKDQLEFARLADGADVHVRVPQYPGMAVGQTVRVRWGSRIEYFTEIKTVERVAPIDFTIWRDEVIDSIGYLVSVNYSVVETPEGPVQASKILSLNVLPQALNLVQPTISLDNTIVRVAYSGSLTSHTIAVRWRGVKDYITVYKRPPFNGAVIPFNIDPDWVSENRGKRVLVNYSVGVGNDPLIFSQLLRLDIP